MDKIVVSSTETVVLEVDTTSTITSGTYLSSGADGTNSITYASDVDITELLEGSVLVYNAINARWKATNLLQQQTIECGQF